MPNAILTGKEETFKMLGIQKNQKIELEGLINKFREQFEQEYYDCDDVGEEIIVGLKAVKDQKIDKKDWREILNEI